MKRAGSVIVLFAVVGAAVAAAVLWPRGGRRAGGAVPQQAYVWQRAWTEDVARAVRDPPGHFDRLVVLAAEVAWTGQRGRAVRVAIDYEGLRETSVPVGLALRVGSYRGKFAGDDESARLLRGIAAAAVEQARSAGVEPAELQIDFDCAESALTGYRRWVEAVKAEVAPVPVTITALPCWLDREAFRHLAAAADGYVLQVHSLTRPAGPDELPPLCDPSAARRAVERASRLGVPFRVALPTYGYVVAFDSAGRFVGISAEGPSLRWPAGVRLRTLRADPAAMAGLVRAWTLDRPEAMRGIVWYRLPTDADRLNWCPATLGCVMAGRRPRPELHARARPAEPGVYEIELLNSGSGDAPLAVVVRVRCGVRPVAGDALGGFERIDAGNGEVRFRAAGGSALPPLRPGQRKAVGWLRLGSDREVHVDVSSMDS